MDIQDPLYNPEIWGGIECTINRIGDTFRDQLHYGGYYERRSDLDQIAKLGIKALRFPVLWEAHQQVHEEEEIDWSRTKEDLEKIRNYDIFTCLLFWIFLIHFLYEFFCFGWF